MSKIDKKSIKKTSTTKVEIIKDKELEKTPEKKTPTKKKTTNKAFNADAFKEHAMELSNVKNVDSSVYDVKTGKKIEMLIIDDLTSAPADWNKFPDPSPEEYLRLKFSLMEEGIFSPIIVWDRGDDFIILSGHTRVRAYKEIRDTQDGNPMINYNKIPSIVYAKDEITEEEARGIIIEANTLQRGDNTKVMPFVVQHRVNVLAKRKDKKGDTLYQAAKEMNLSRTKIYEEKVFASEIEEDIVNLMYEGILTRKAALRFARIDRSAQKTVYERLLKGKDRKYMIKNNIDERTKQLRKDMSFEEIKYFLSNDVVKGKVTVSVKVPAELEVEFLKMAKEWVKSHVE